MKLWKNITRKPAVAGQFYPETKEELSSELDALLENGVDPVHQELPLHAVISPHAGYMFSGKVAASAFNQIAPKASYNSVFVIASSHRYHFEGASLYTPGNYSTPLGKITADKELIEELLRSSSIFKDKPEAHEQEHSLEVQLPFLQKKLGSDFKLIPILMGTNNAEDCKKVAQALQPYFVPENLFVISTDFSHFPSYENANKVDFLTAQAICKNNPRALLDAIDLNETFMVENLTTSLCGWTSVLTLLYLTESGNYQISEVEYQNSGDSKIYGDKKRVVGYWALAVHSAAATFIISDAEKKEIIEISKNAIKSYLNTGKRGEQTQARSNGILAEKTGAFVSVYVKDELRGCIGGFAQEKTLNELLQEMAVSSVTDRRFENIQLEELNDLSIEVSVLTPLKRIYSADEIELGRHGIYIKAEYNTGTFLPQVAKKTGWSVDEFLGRCSRDKAGLGWEGWKTAELYTYEAIIIKESEQ